MAARPLRGENMQKNAIMQKVARVAFVVIIAAMLFLFFSNDFGLVDIHKASIVVAVGVDYGEEGYAVTAQAAVPTPAQGSERPASPQATGKGQPVPAAADVLISKPGFTPSSRSVTSLCWVKAVQAKTFLRCLTIFTATTMSRSRRS